MGLLCYNMAYMNPKGVYFKMTKRIFCWVLAAVLLLGLVSTAIATLVA